MTLGNYLAAQMRVPWQWGAADCCMFPADWAVTWGLGDPVAGWRGRYDDEAGARRLLADAGGIVGLWQRQLETIGIFGVNDPVAGDVGVIAAVNLDGEREDVGAIWTGRRWAFRAPAGIAVASADFLRCWGPRHG